VLEGNGTPRIPKGFQGLVAIDTTYVRHRSYWQAIGVVKAHGLEFRVVRCGPSRLAGELSRAAHGLRRDHPQEAPMKGSKKGGKGGKMPPGKGGKC